MNKPKGSSPMTKVLALAGAKKPPLTPVVKAKKKKNKYNLSESQIQYLATFDQTREQIKAKKQYLKSII